jgi:ASC-1-like (ASCH) protein
VGNNMAIIKKKIWPEYFNQVESGNKKYELRLNDFDINEGDTLILEEWDPKSKKYTGRNIEKKVGFVGRFKINELFWPEKDIREKGILVISLD